MNQPIPSNNSKKLMRIAVLGIRPADEVMLKGYLRILLRLEAELEWVTANNPIIDLFMIHNEFRNADSVTRLLASKPGSTALYVSRADNEVGQLVGNHLTLPIKDLEPLNQWLLQNVAILKPIAPPQPQIQSTRPKLQTVDDILANRAKQNQTMQATPMQAQNVGQAGQANMAVNPKAVSFARIVTRLQKKEATYLRLVDGAGNVLAYIHPQTQRIWANTENLTIQTSWQLQLDGFTDKDTPNHGKDLVQWLWECALQNVDELITLISPNQTYYLTSWVKPKDDNFRHNTLKIQTILEKRPLIFSEIVKLSKSPVEDVKRTLVGLISAGLVSPNVYAQLMNTVDNPQSIETTAPSIEQQPQAKVEENAMGSFLSRLRRKLGI